MNISILSRKQIDPDSRLGIYLRLLEYGYKQKKYFAVAVLGMFLYAMTDAGLAAIIKPLFDESLMKQDKTFGLGLALAILGIIFLRGVGAYLSGVFLAYVNQSINRELRSSVFHQMLRMRIGYFDAHPPGTLVSKLTYDVVQASGSITGTLLVLIRDGLTVLALLGWMFYISWMLTLILLLAVPLIALLLLYVNRKLRGAGKKLQNFTGMITSDIDQMVRGIRTIKIFGNNRYEYMDFERSNKTLMKQGIKFARAKAISTPVALFFIGLMFAGIVYLLAFEAIAVHISIGSTASFFVALVMLMRPIKSLVNVNPTIQQGVVGAKSVFDILDAPVEYGTLQVITPKPLTRTVAFNQLSYRYPNSKHYALNHVDFEVSHGEMVALVGHSGAGKTTLINMIPRFYDPEEGSISYDGKDIRQIPIPEWRQHISYVGQDAMLFYDTVRNNITYGREVSDSQLEAVMEKTCITEFIGQLPHGVETVIGRGGVQLSGGQGQRIAIARALLRETPIMLFDEVTSFLDTQTEQVIKDTLVEIMGSCTLFIIAHRLSTVEQADRIIVMEEGYVVEQGKHQELLDKKAKYYALYRAGQGKGLLE